MLRVRFSCCPLAAIFLILGANLVLAKDYILLGRFGETLLLDETTSDTKWIAKPSLERGDQVGEAVLGFDREGSATLYIHTEVNLRSYALCPLAPRAEYVQFDTDTQKFIGILYDTRNKGPAVVAQLGWADSTKEKLNHSDLVTLDAERRTLKTDIDDCTFVRSSDIVEHIPKGFLRVNDMATRFPRHATEFQKRPSRAWVLCGQSALITTYSRQESDREKGKKARNTQYFIERSTGNTHMFDNEDIGFTYTFEDVAVIRGIVITEGVYGIPPNSGKYGFYFPGADDLVKCIVDPKMMIVFADFNSAFFARGNGLYKMPISRTGCGTAVKFLSLDFEVFQMFPVPEK